MSSRLAVVGLALLLGVTSTGCRYFMTTVVDNRTVRLDLYPDILLGDGRREVLLRLGPPDQVEYLRELCVFDCVSSFHRGNELEIFVPTDIIPGFNPLFFLSIPRFFFDESEIPDAFAPTLAERAGRGGVSAALRLVPFTSGEEILIVKGHKLRGDRLRIVFDRETRSVVGKSLRLATGEYAEESLTDRVLLTE